MRAVVHIGFHKTGTTALQRRFFPNLPGCTFLTHGGREGRSLFRLLANNLMNAPDEEFLRETIHEYIADARERASGTLLISLESLSGSIFQGAYNRERNAVRLRAVLPDAHILIVVRHQHSMIRSAFAQHIRRGGYSSFPDFLLDRAPDCHFNLEHLRYDTLVACHQELFGPDHVRVLAYEHLIADPSAFLSEVRSLVDPTLPPDLDLDLTLERVGRSLSPASLWLTRHGNRLFVKSRINPKPALVPLRRAHELPGFLQRAVDPKLFAHATRELNPHEEDLLRSVLPMYEESNAALERMTGLPLRELGYPLPQAAVSATIDVHRVDLPDERPRVGACQPLPDVQVPIADPELVVYVGPPNPASAALVNHLFPSLPDCRLVKASGRGRDPIYSHLKEALRSGDNDEGLTRTARAWFAETAARHPTLLLADEALSGDAFDGCRGRADNARRLREVLPRARILLVVRRQDDMLRWIYSTYLRRGGGGSFADLIADRVPGCTIDLDCLRYDEIVRMHRAQVGSDRVTLVPFELYSEDPGAFLAEIASIVGTPLPGPGSRDLPIGRPLSAAARAMLRSGNRTVRPSEFNPRPRFDGGRWATKAAEARGARGRPPLPERRWASLARGRDSDPKHGRPLRGGQRAGRGAHRRLARPVRVSRRMRLLRHLRMGVAMTHT